MVYAVDFDGTLCEDNFPEIGKPHLNRIEAVKRLQWRGHKVILWTCRNGEALSEAVKWCRGWGTDL